MCILINIYHSLITGDARKQFKTYVNILSTMKNEGSEKFLVLRKKYLNECPADDNLSMLSSQSELLMSPGSRSTISEHEANISASFTAIDGDKLSSPYREPPPYKPPPEVVKLQALESETKVQYRECVDEFKSAMNAFEARRGNIKNSAENINSDVNVDSDAVPPPVIPPRKRNSSASDFVPFATEEVGSDFNKENEVQSDIVHASRTLEKQISVKEATKKFNLIASEEEANKITSPPAKKKPEKVSENCYVY